MSETNQAVKEEAGRLSAADWDKIIIRAGELMEGHKFGCSEAVMLSFQEVLGPEYLPPAAVAMSSAFRGGMGGAGCTCGALAAGEMVLGAIFGYYGDAMGQQNKEDVSQARNLYKELHDRFRDMHRATCCRVLTKNMEHDSPERKEQCLQMVKAVAGLTAA